MNKNIIKLIKQGDINLQNEDGYTALMFAVADNSLEIAELLLRMGADLNIQDKWGDTALMKATNWGRLGIARLLIKTGAKLDIQDKWGKTALDIAQKKEQCDYQEIIKLLTPEKTTNGK
jgi:ankyrin repeat protein